jgi:hypothetical protein
MSAEPFFESVLTGLSSRKLPTRCRMLGPAGLGTERQPVIEPPNPPILHPLLETKNVSNVVQTPVRRCIQAARSPFGSKDRSMKLIVQKSCLCFPRLQVPVEVGMPGIDDPVIEGVVELPPPERPLLAVDDDDVPRPEES